MTQHSPRRDRLLSGAAAWVDEFAAPAAGRPAAEVWGASYLQPALCDGHIVSRWDALSDVTVFAQDDPFEHAPGGGGKTTPPGEGTTPTA
eukprot:gene56407-62707_t